MRTAPVLRILLRPSRYWIVLCLVAFPATAAAQTASERWNWIPCDAKPGQKGKVPIDRFVENALDHFGMSRRSQYNANGEENKIDVIGLSQSDFEMSRPRSNYLDQKKYDGDIKRKRTMMFALQDFFDDLMKKKSPQLNKLFSLQSGKVSVSDINKGSDGNGIIRAYLNRQIIIACMNPKKNQDKNRNNMAERIKSLAHPFRLRGKVDDLPVAREPVTNEEKKRFKAASSGTLSFSGDLRKGTTVFAAKGVIGISMLDLREQRRKQLYEKAKDKNNHKNGRKEKSVEKKEKLKYYLVPSEKFDGGLKDIIPYFAFDQRSTLSGSRTKSSEVDNFTFGTSFFGAWTLNKSDRSNGRGPRKWPLLRVNTYLNPEYTSDREARTKILSINGTVRPNVRLGTNGLLVGGPAARFLNTDLNYQFDVLGRLSFGHVFNDGDKSSLRDKESFLRYGATIQLVLTGRDGTPLDRLKLTLAYHVWDGITGSPDFADRFEARLAYQLDEKGYVALKFSYDNGRADRTFERINRWLVGLSLKY